MCHYFTSLSQTQKATGRVVAIKKIAMKLGKYTEGANFTALREIKLLQELKHEHIIEVSIRITFPLVPLSLVCTWYLM